MGRWGTGRKEKGRTEQYEGVWKAGGRHRGEDAREGTDGKDRRCGWKGQEVRMERTGGADKISGEEKEQFTAENGKVTGEIYTRE